MKHKYHSGKSGRGKSVKPKGTGSTVGEGASAGLKYSGGEKGRVGVCPKPNKSRKNP